MKRVKHLKSARGVFITLGVIFLLIYAISFLTPLFWALMTSFKREIEFMVDKFAFPSEFYLENYVYVWNEMAVPVKGIGNIYIVEMFFNSIVYTLVCTLTHTLTPCIAAYAVAKYKFKFGEFMYGIVIVTMILPVVGNLGSSLQVAKAVGTYDSLFGVAIMKGSFLGTSFLIFYAAFKGLPNDYKEAAEIDGASQLQILLSIVLPLVKTTIGALALLNFITYWNDYNTAMIYLPSMPTISYGLYRFTRSTDNKATFVTVWVSACMLVTIPIFIVFMLFKDKLIGNLAVGGIKG